jgi:hypothetical protein
MFTRDEHYRKNSQAPVTILLIGDDDETNIERMAEIKT